MVKKYGVGRKVGGKLYAYGKGYNSKTEAEKALQYYKKNNLKKRGWLIFGEL